MEVTDNRRQITVGIFIFIGLAVFILGVFTLGSQKKTFTKSFSVNVVFDDIQGLKNGANIWFSGVKVGTVKKIEFYGTSQVKLLLNIEQDAQQYIHKDATASLSSDGLIGNKIVVITGGSVKAPFIEDGDVIHVSTALSTDEMMKTFQVTNKNLVAITTDFKSLSANLVAGKGAAGALLADEELANRFRAIVANLQNTTQATTRMAADLNRFSSTLNNKNGLANKLFTDTVVFAQLKTSSGELQKVSKSAAALTDNLKEATANVNRKLQGTDSPAGVLLNDQATAEQIKKTMVNLEASTATLNEDLKALQSNFLFRGYFKKKAKAEAKAAEEAAKQ